MLDLNVPSLLPSQTSVMHMVVGAVSLYAGHTFSMMFENQKTLSQLPISLDTNNSTFLQRLTRNMGKGSAMAFFRGLTQMVGRIGGNILFESKLGIKIPVVGEGLFGTLVGTAISHPLDLWRTNQIGDISGTVWTPPNFAKSDSPTDWFFRLYTNGGFQWAIAYELSTCVVANSIRELLLSNVFLRPFFMFFALDPNSHRRIAWFIGQALARMALAPLEYQKKKEQMMKLKNPTLKISRAILSPDSMLSKYRGVLWTIPETFGEVIVTHWTFVTLAAIFHNAW